MDHDLTLRPSPLGPNCVQLCIDMQRMFAEDTVLVSGGETDVCILGTVLGAVDRGYRVVAVVDALCSSSDEMHDAMLAVYRRRYGQQIETVLTQIAIDEWIKAQRSM